MNKKVYITGSAGFIGFHVSERFLQAGYQVFGIDSLTDYYDVNLKISRNRILQNNKNYTYRKIDIINKSELNNSMLEFAPDIVIHLAAQAGVRHSIENPDTYIETNILGTYNILEACRWMKPKHLMMASTSSVYGANKEMPFTETHSTDTPISLYAATKKTGESISHAYSHLYNIPITNFRFFTVYGPWGRPDMALFKFTKAILEGQPIDLYNGGDMLRDFTFVDDIATAIKKLSDKVPKIDEPKEMLKVAPWRVVNIGNSAPVHLTKYLQVLEECLGEKAIINNMPMQPGDVSETFSSVHKLESLTGWRPETEITDGIKKFVDWYKGHYS